MASAPGANRVTKAICGEEPQKNTPRGFQYKTERGGEMANENNLIPFNQRTEDERRRIATEGGKASGEARRAKKTMREYANFLMGLPVSDRRKFNKLSRAGVPPEGCDNKMLVVFGLVQAAQNGDVAAAKELRSILGEDVEMNLEEGVQIVDDL